MSQKCNLLVIAISKYADHRRLHEEPDLPGWLDCVARGLGSLKGSRFVQEYAEPIFCLDEAATHEGIYQAFTLWMARMTRHPNRMHTCIYLGHGEQFKNYSCIVSHDWRHIPIYDVYNHLCEKECLRASLFFDCSQTDVPEEQVLDVDFTRQFVKYELPARCKHNVVKMSISCSPTERAYGSPPRGISKYVDQLVKGLETDRYWGKLFHRLEDAWDMEEFQHPHVKGNAGGMPIEIRPGEQRSRQVCPRPLP